MDPLSLSASIIAILQLTSTITEYLNQVRKASKEQRDLAIEAGNLYGLLVRLRFRVDAAEDTQDAWYAQVKALGSPNGPLDQLREGLEKLVCLPGIVGTEKKRDRVISSLQWNWNKSDALETLQRIERIKSLINLALQDDLFTLTQAIHGQMKHISDGISSLGINTKEESSRIRILQWLRAPDPASNYNAALQRRYPGTGTWLLKHPSFLQWKEESSSLIWVFGDAGCGKTFLCSTALEYMLQCQKANVMSTALCYFYFDFKDLGKQCCDSLLRSLIKQLLDLDSDWSLVQDMYTNSCNNGNSQPSGFMFRDLLQRLVKKYKHVSIVVDALDESTEINTVLDLLSEIKSWPTTSIFATSRQKREIEMRWSGIQCKIKVVPSLAHSDIEAYVRHQVTTDVRFKKWNATAQEEIMFVLISKADGMYDLSRCPYLRPAKKLIGSNGFFASLRLSRNALSVSIANGDGGPFARLTSLKRTLASLPSSLDETYARIFHDIESSGHLDDAIILLRWLSTSLEPLNVLELVETLAIQPGEEGFFDSDDRLPEPEDIKLICSNLVTYWDFSDANNQFNTSSFDNSSSSSQPVITSNDALNKASVRLSHFSVKEYLLSGRCYIPNVFMPSDCHCYMAECCFTYMKHVFDLGPLTRELVASFPLIFYATRYCYEHLKLSTSVSNRLFDLAVELLTNPVYCLANAQIRGYGWKYGLQYSNFAIEAGELEHPLVYVAAAGVPGLLDKILKNDVYQNLLASDLDSALTEAARSGDEADIQVLLKAGAVINGECGHGYNVLGAAASRGRVEVVRMLLNAGADINAPYLYPDVQPLSSAAKAGQGPIVQLLLDEGADVDSCSVALMSCLHIPSVMGMIIRAEADVDARSRLVTQSLESAVSRGLVAAVQILIEAGADVNQADSQLRPLLEAAALSGDLDILRMLFEAGAKPKDPSSLLVAAVRGGDLNIIRYLLEHGVPINGEAGAFTNGLALQEAALLNKEVLTSMLLSKGASVNIFSTPYGSALQAAVTDLEPAVILFPNTVHENRIHKPLAQTTIVLEFFQADVVLTLTRRPVEQDAVLVSCLAFQPCEDSKRQDIAKLFLARDGMQPLQDDLHMPQAAISEIASDVLGYLEHDLQKRVGSGIVTRTDARRLCEPELLLLQLCDVGAAIDRDSCAWIPDGRIMYDSPTPSSFTLTENLVDHGADVHVLGGPYGTVLQAASRHGNKDIVKLLLQRGAKVNQEGGFFGSSLQAACAAFREDVELVELLLAAGADIHVSGGVYGSPLSAACFQGFEDIVRLLLKKGADVNIRGGRYRTPLQAACASPDCSVNLVKFLLDAGADPLIEGGRFGSASNALVVKSYRPVMVHREANDMQRKAST